MTATRITTQDIKDATVTDSDIASANKDGAQGTPSMRTLAGTPSTQAFGDSAAVGASTTGAASDHKHAMMANPTPAFATPAIVLGSAAAAGAAATVIRSDGTIAAFDATSPSTQAFGDSAVVGVAAFAARRDHKHAMPANPVSAIGVIVDSEVPSGTINGVNAAFVVNGGSAIIAGAAHVYKNGIRQLPGAGNDYTIVDATGTITFLAGNLPQTGDNVLVDYRK